MNMLISISEFQKTFNVSRSTVYRLAKSGKINFVHIGRAVRIRRQDVEEFYTSLAGCDAAEGGQS